jgi:hypothetical protein
MVNASVRRQPGGMSEDDPKSARLANFITLGTALLIVVAGAVLIASV